jgi:regulator of protease activity HflC (stomatin/prohibitin superfamily)
MRSPVAGIVTLIVLLVVVIVGYSSIFTVSQTEQALVVRLGRPVAVVSEPGLNFKAPFIDTVISIDKRILDLENPSSLPTRSGSSSTLSPATGSRTRCASTRASVRSRPPTSSSPRC